MRYSVLLSLHDRDSVDLQKTFKQLAKAASGRDDVEFIVCFDFPEDCEELSHVETLAEIFQDTMEPSGVPVSLIRFDTLEHHPDTFNLDGHNNPVAVNNALIDAAKGDNLVWVSSDMIVSPLMFERIDKHIGDDGVLDTVWCSRVIDQDSMAEFCGPSRPFPMMWCVAHPSYGTLRHDLALLRGFGYDDNDWMARVALKVGSITIDLCHIAIHQTHGRVSEIGQLASGKAYSQEAAPGWEASTAYIREKWGGVPFDGQTLDVEFNQLGEYIILNVNGVKAGPEYPIQPGSTPKKKTKRKSRAKKVAAK